MEKPGRRIFDSGTKTDRRLRRRLPLVAVRRGGTMSIETVAENLDLTWVLVCAVLVMFMQAGFAFLEIGFSRGKNAGMGIAKIVVNFSIASLVWWACGFALAFGGGGWLFGDSGFFFSSGGTPAGGLMLRQTSPFLVFP